MDIRELDKKQLILLTLLITFVVSIATGIVTVSLMNQMPKSVPQTINNVIQRTIEKVTTVPVPTPVTTTKDNSKDDTNNNLISLSGNGDALVSIYLKNTNVTPVDNTSLDSTTNQVTNTTDTNINTDTNTSANTNGPVAIGQGIIVSDIGLILVDSNLVKEGESYKVILNKTDFDASVLKKFDNGFTILKISPMTNNTTPVTTNQSQSNATIS